jgi:hypothetical protein
LPGKPYCLFHDPDKEQQRTAYRQKGGNARSRKAAVLPPEADDISLRTVGDVVGLLEQTANHVRKGVVDVRVGNCLGYLAGIALKALEENDWAEQLEAVRRELDEMRRGTGSGEKGPGKAPGGGPAGGGDACRG